MRRSLFLSCALLALGGFWAWQNRKQLEDELQQKSRAIAEAGAAGISPEEVRAGMSHHRTRAALRQKNDQMKSLVEKIHALGPRWDDPRFLLDPASGIQKSREEIRDEIQALGSAQLSALIHELFAGNPLADVETGLMQFVFNSLAQKDPHLLALQLVENWERLKGFKKMVSLVDYTFLLWSARDPAGVDEWIHLNSNKIREIADEKAKASIIRGVAQSEPGRAFGLLSALQPTDLIEAISMIISGAEAKSMDLGDKNLKAWRDYISKLPEPEGEELARSSVVNFATWASFDGFDKGTRWLGEAGFTQDELAAIAGGLYLKDSHTEPTRWIDWIGSQLPPDKATAPIQSLVREWTQADYQAAGKWLTATPNGPTKNAAVRAYAETVAKVDPEIAKQWALTLPPGPEREETLQRIQAK